MKKVFVFLALALVIAIGFAAYNTTAGLTAPKDGDVRVMVEFQPGKKNEVSQALNAVGARFHYSFDDLNTFAVTVPNAALEGLKHNPNIVSIEEDAIRYAYAEGQTVPYGIDAVQARDVWDANRDGVLDSGAPTGAGRLVCIIDSGIKASHEDFAGVNLVGGYPTGWNTDTCGHGTHVAGTISAVNNTLGVVGVTPGKTSLYFVKVFDGPTCGWSYSSTLIDAANRCAAAGANVISMSLGGTVKSKTEETAFAKIYSQGILSVAAAGNDGNTRLSYPASYASVMSVAAVDSNNVVADFSQQNSAVEISAPGVGVLSTVPWLSVSSVTVDGEVYAANHIENAPYASANGTLVDGGLCTTTGAWSGKVVLCQRGDISFYDKVMNVQNSGGTAAVIYNNLAGDFLGTLGDGYSSIIPAISVSDSVGGVLLTKIGLNATVSSTFDPNGSGYEAWDGTSMATPHISGLAALIWSADPSKTNAEIREAINATALDLGAAGRDVAYGYGLAQAYAAWQYLGGGGVDPTPTPTATPTATPTDEPTETPVPGTMSATVVDMWYAASGRSNYVYTKVAVLANNQPVVGANVSLSISLGGSVIATGSGVTGSDGTVTFSLKTKSTGTFISTVTNVTHSSFTWDGIEVSGTVNVP
ncbi:MAG TPA: peptidase S8 [Chloroflexi bacterium]|nr:peptidase S8 [Chloroflexota bacterium]